MQQGQRQKGQKPTEPLGKNAVYVLGYAAQLGKTNDVQKYPFQHCGIRSEKGNCILSTAHIWANENDGFVDLFMTRINKSVLMYFSQHLTHTYI